VKTCQHSAVIAREDGPPHGVRPTLAALPRPLCRYASIILPGDDAVRLTELSNVVAYVCRPSRKEDRPMAFSGHPQPATNVSATSVFRRPKGGCGNCGNCGNAFFGGKWRRGWDSNPRYACTHNGFRDRPDRPLWHLSGAPLIGGRFCRGNSAVGGADIPLFSPESGVSGVDLGGFLRIFRPPPAGHSGPPCSFVLSGILGMGPANPPICCGVDGRVRSAGKAFSQVSA
jgi:hypothetical protein